MDKVKVGVIGVGNISWCHLEGYSKDPRVELYAFCDLDEAKLKEKSEKYGVKRLYTDVDTMLKECPELDAVSVCVWNINHSKCAIAALKAGKHVLCEKPIAMTVEQALEMQKAAEEAGKVLQIGFCCRYGTDAKIINEYRDKGFFGDFYYAKASYLRRFGNPGGWFADVSMSGGGPLIDLGVHIIDLTRYLMGNPKPVAVFGATYRKVDRSQTYQANPYGASTGGLETKNDVEDLAAAMVRYDNGAVLNVEASYCMNLKQDVYAMELFGSKGGVRICPDMQMYTDMNGFMVDITPVDMIGMEEDQALFDRETAHFIDCVQGKAECIAPAQDGVDILRIIRAIYESAETGSEVKL